MSYTVSRVTPGGRPYTIIGPNKQTTTDVTVTTNSEAVTAADLGLNAVYGATGLVKTGVSTDTATYVTALPDTGGANVTVAGFTADGTAATTASSTVIRVTATGY